MNIKKRLWHLISRPVKEEGKTGVGKSKEYKYHEGMIGDININDKGYKEIVIEEITTSNLSASDKSELLKKARDIKPSVNRERSVPRMAKMPKVRVAKPRKPKPPKLGPMRKLKTGGLTRRVKVGRSRR